MTIQIQCAAFDCQVFCQSYILIQFYSSSSFHVFKLCLCIRCNFISFFYCRSCAGIITDFCYICPVQTNACILIYAHNFNVHTGSNNILFQIRYSKADLRWFSLIVDHRLFVDISFKTRTLGRVSLSFKEILCIFIDCPVICCIRTCCSQFIGRNCSYSCSQSSCTIFVDDQCGNTILKASCCHRSMFHIIFGCIFIC